MLSNLAVRDLDREISDIAVRDGLAYTRYADDLVLSTRDPGFSRERAAKLIREVYVAMGHHGLSPNIAKTRVVPPGARKVVLGLVVDGDRPRLPREFRDRMRQHFHYLRRADVGPVAHAKRRGFESVIGFRDHIVGLIAFAGQIDPDYADRLRGELESLDWPL